MLAYYSSIILNSFGHLLFPKLCWHKPSRHIYGSQPSIVVFECKTASLGPELQVSVGAWPHLWFFALKIATLAPELQVSMGPSSHLCFCAFTTATL